jgi:predicted GIY-YIG superfamily endonuclease
LRGGLSVGDLHFNLAQHRHDLLGLVPLAGHNQPSSSCEFSLTSAGTKNPGQVTFYVGVTDDPFRRLQEHNEGKGADWTAKRRPVKLGWREEHPSLSAARKRENQIKRWATKRKLH